MLKITTEALTIAERSELEQREAKIEGGLRAFYEVGQELIAIRDRRLYRERFSNFEAYLRDRWEMSKSRGYELMGASSVIENLSGIPDRPANAAQVEPLTPLDPEQQRQAWSEALATAPNGKPTAAHVSDVVKRLTKPVQLQPEMSATVVDESSPHQGQQVKVQRVEGAIAICELPNGDTYPFIATELHAEALPTPDPTPDTRHPTPKLSEVEHLKSLLRRVVAEAQVPTDLLAEIKAVL